jgi:hypothetical protein
MGVSPIAPVDVLKLNPDGNAGETLYVSVPVPPKPVTGVKEAAVL